MATALAVVAFDTETTGLRGAVIQAALVELDASGYERDVFSGIVLPPVGYPLDPNAVAVHGLTETHIATHGQEPTHFFAELVLRLRDAHAKGKRIVAHNRAFDMAHLNETITAIGIPASL